ncbi:MAG: hypothetical protein R2712_13325 [Vicinamibacterales bacterium]
MRGAQQAGDGGVLQVVEEPARQDQVEGSLYATDAAQDVRADGRDGGTEQPSPIRCQDDRVGVLVHEGQMCPVQRCGLVDQHLEIAAAAAGQDQDPRGGAGGHSPPDLARLLPDLAAVLNRDGRGERQLLDPPRRRPARRLVGAADEVLDGLEVPGVAPRPGLQPLHERRLRMRQPCGRQRMEDERRRYALRLEPHDLIADLTRGTGNVIAATTGECGEQEILRLLEGLNSTE